LTRSQAEVAYDSSCPSPGPAFRERSSSSALRQRGTGRPAGNRFGKHRGQRSFWHARPADTYHDPMMAAPGLRAEWDAGDHPGHHRYQNIGHSQRAGAGRAQAMS